MDYLLLKHVHQGAVLVSVTGFVLRGAAGLAGAAWVRGRLARTLPHMVDTVLLGSAVLMAWMIGLSPFDAPWLMAKIVGLVAYVLLGVVALRPHRPRVVRAAAWLAALATVVWIASVAMTKSPLGLLAGLSPR